MSITIYTAVTGFTATGGSPIVFTTDGQTVVNGKHFHVAAETDFRTRTNVSVKNRNPVRQPDGTYSKGKRQVTLTKPYIKADGTVVYNVERYESEVDPETPAADALNNRRLLTQLLFDSEMEEFHTAGTLPA